MIISSSVGALRGRVKDEMIIRQWIYRLWLWFPRERGEAARPRKEVEG